MKEIRSYSPENQEEFRAFEENGKKFITGYAARFDIKSRLLTERGQTFYEIIEKGAFTDVLSQNPDVIANINHNRGQIMARTKSGTLSLSQDEKGLIYRFEVPNVSYANDVYELIKRGDMFESSFAFNVSDKNYQKTSVPNDFPLRTLSKIDKLYDVAIVVDGAYSNTDVVARDLETLDKEEQDKIQNEEKQKNDDIYKKQLRKKALEGEATYLKLKYKY
jgi:uncharacterized protein